MKELDFNKIKYLRCFKKNILGYVENGFYSETWSVDFAPS